MRLMAVTGLILAMTLGALSSYLRLDHSGIGCKPWPECYARIGARAEQATVENAYERLVAEARQPMSWARPMHRLIASVLGLLVLGLAGASLLRKQHRVAAFILLGLIVFLAWLGIYSENLHSAAIVIGNLAGGFTVLGMFGWVVFASGKSPSEPQQHASLRLWVGVAIGVLSVQILVGGLTSANFAAGACATLPDCHGQWLPGDDVLRAFDLSRSFQVDDLGFVVGGAERASIHVLHRAIAVLTLAIVLAVGIKTAGSDKSLRPIGVLVCVGIVAELIIGVAAVKFNIPIALAVAHNTLAALLLLGLIRIRSSC